jgi:hypothetical protein
LKFLRIPQGKNICGNNICDQKITLLHVFFNFPGKKLKFFPAGGLAVGTVSFSDRKNIYRKYFSLAVSAFFFFFFIWAMTVVNIHDT